MEKENVLAFLLVIMYTLANILLGTIITLVFLDYFNRITTLNIIIIFTVSTELILGIIIYIIDKTNRKKSIEKTEDIETQN